MRQNTKHIMLAIIVSSFAAMASTNMVAVVSTNWVNAAPSFRTVNGQLYNVDKSSKFESIEGYVIGPEKGCVIIEVVKPIYSIRASSAQSTGNFIGGHASTVKIGEDTVCEAALTNYTDQNPTVREKIKGRFMPVGKISTDRGTLKLYDYGKPHGAFVVTTNLIPAR